MRKRKIIVFVFSVILLMSLTSVVYGLITLGIKENKKIILNEDRITLDSNLNYRSNISSGTTLNLSNKTINDINSNNIKYDIVFHSNNYDNIASLDITSSSNKYHVIENQSSPSFTVYYTLKDENVETWVSVFVTISNEHNRYIENAFELYMLNNEFKHLVNDVNDMTIDKTKEKFSFEYYQKYYLIYFLEDITITNPSILNIPGKYNLLFSNLILNSNLEISHHYGGVNYLDSITGNVISNNQSRLHLYSYNGYFDVSSNINKCYDIISKQSNNDYTLLALEYIKAYIPSNIDNTSYRLVNNIELPDRYHGYDRYFTYELTNELGQYLPFNGTFTRLPQTTNRKLKITIKNSMGEVLDSVSDLDVMIIGTSDESKLSYLQTLIKEQMSKNTNLNSLDLISIITQYYKETKSSDVCLDSEAITLDLGDAIFASIYYQTISEAKRTNQITIKFKEIEKTFDRDKVYKEIKLYHNDIELTRLYIDIAKDIYMTKTETINVSTGNLESKGIDIEFKGLSNSEITNLLFKHVKNLYMTDSSIDVVKLNQTNITQGTKELFKGNLGITSIEFKGFICDKDQYDLINETLKFNDTSYDMITFIDGKMTINPSIVFDRTKELYYICKVQYANQEVFFKKCKIIIPESGLGVDSDNAIYLENNMFASTFDDIYIIESIDSTTFDTHDSRLGLNCRFISQNNIPIESNNQMILIDRTNPNSGCFAKIVKSNQGIRDTYGIEIIVQNAPITNTDVEIEFEFTYQSTVISTQVYRFVIPGVLKCGENKEFKSIELYQKALELYGNFNGYLLYTSIQNKIDTFSLVNLTNDIDLSGIEYLKFDKLEISANGVNVTNLESLLQNQNTITSLKLTGLNLNDSSFKLLNLSNFSSLKHLDLSSNQIENISSIGLYRSIESLVLQNNSIRSIENIDQYVPYLKILNVKDNKIRTFYELLKLKYLTLVDITNNIDTSWLDNLYGTMGLSNMALYAKLYDKVKIKVTETEVITKGNNLTLFSGGATITQDIIDSCIIIDSFIYQDTYKVNETINIPDKIYINNSNLDYYLVTVEKIRNNEIIENSISSIKAITYSIVVSIEVNGTKVYKEIKINVI